MMSEHEAPTVARATVWLDTSNDVPTKRGERLDETETAPAIELEASLDELETTRFRRGALAETAALDAKTSFAAFASVDTDVLDQTLLVEQRLARAARVRMRARRALALLGCVAALAAAFALGRQSASWRAQPSQPRIAAPASVTAAPRPARVPASSPRDRKEPVDLDADIPNAVEALARGDYDRALGLYTSLARQRPNDAALAAIVKLLGTRQSARCTAQRGEASCGG